MRGTRASRILQRWTTVLINLLNHGTVPIPLRRPRRLDALVVAKYDAAIARQFLAHRTRAGLPLIVDPTAGGLVGVRG